MDFSTLPENELTLKAMTLSAEEFIRRFLKQILPTGFAKIRHYGFLSSRGKQKR